MTRRFVLFVLPGSALAQPIQAYAPSATDEGRSPSLPGRPREGRLNGWARGGRSDEGDVLQPQPLRIPPCFQSADCAAAEETRRSLLGGVSMGARKRSRS